MNEIEKEFDEIVLGIDKQETEDDNGWWETSTGAEFGKKKKKEIKKFYRKAIIDLIRSVVPERDIRDYDINNLTQNYITTGYNACRQQLIDNLKKEGIEIEEKER